jgi:hypothetical protein
VAGRSRTVTLQDTKALVLAEVCRRRFDQFSHVLRFYRVAAEKRR